jgi:hypothetical protein
MDGPGKSCTGGTRDICTNDITTTSLEAYKFFHMGMATDPIPLIVILQHISHHDTNNKTAQSLPTQPHGAHNNIDMRSHLFEGEIWIGNVLENRGKTNGST